MLACACAVALSAAAPANVAAADQEAEDVSRSAPVNASEPFAVFRGWRFDVLNSVGECVGFARKCAWERTYGGDGDDKISAILSSNDGGAFIAGNSRVSMSDRYRPWVLRVNAYGDIIWMRPLGGPKSDLIRNLAAGPRGGVYAVGRTQSRGSGAGDVWVVRLDQHGRRLWERAIGGPEDDRARGAAATPDGGVFVNGFRTQEGANGRDFWAMRLTPNGELSWARTLGGGGHDDGYDAAVLENGDVVAVGSIWLGAARGRDLLVVRFDEEGETVWREWFNRDAFDSGTAVAVAPNGDIFALAQSSSDGLRVAKIWALRLKPTGELIWDRTFDSGAARAEAWDLAALPSGGALIAATAWSDEGLGGDALLLNITEYGRVRWERRFGGPLWDHASSVRVLAEGGYLLGGHTTSAGDGYEDAWLLRLDRQGRLLEADASSGDPGE